MNAASRNTLLRFQLGTRVKSYRLLNRPSSDGHGGVGIEPLGEGGSGVVYLAAQNLHGDVEVLRALKFFLYRDDIAELTAHGTPVSKDDFLTEVKNIASLSHENLTKVIDAGMHLVDALEVPFIVTEYIPGSTLRELIERKQQTKQGAPDITRDPDRILNLLIEVGLAVKHLHDRGFAHCDIAPKNIFLNESEGFRPILGDLGLAKNVNRSRPEVLIAGTRAYMPPEFLDRLNKQVAWETFIEMHPRWDLWAFCETGIHLLNMLDAEKVPAWRRALVTCFEESKRGERYRSIGDLIGRMQFLRPVHREVAAVPELSASISGKVRKLMPVQALVTSPRVRRLIQHPALVRLSKVPQLSTTLIAFPAATHTRYEHSLGVMETIRRYVLALLDQEEFLEHLSAEKIEVALLSGLFSQLSRFPFSNVLHEVKHQNEKGLAQFGKEQLLAEVLTMRDNKERTLLDLVGEGFPLVRWENVQRILLGDKAAFDYEDQVIYSFLNSSLDARVIDFVRRDSMHLGIGEGRAVDLDELLPHLTVYNHKLALRMTGVTVAEQIISLRYWLFNRIYWCRPNRAFVAMVRFLLLELLEDATAAGRIREAAMGADQRQLLGLLQDEAGRLKRRDLTDLAGLLNREQQNLFRVVFDVSTAEAPELKVALDRIERMAHDELKLLAQNLMAEAVPAAHWGRVPGLVPLLIDLPREPGDTKLGGDIVVLGGRQSAAGLTDISGIVRGVNESFDRHLRRLRVFLHPSLLEDPDDQRSRRGIEEGMRGFFLKILT